MNYSALGEKEKALAYLKEVNNKNNISRYISFTCKALSFVRQHPQRTGIHKTSKEFEGKYQKEHKGGGGKRIACF
jgi:hypothetical protein